MPRTVRDLDQTRILQTRKSGCSKEDCYSRSHSTDWQNWDSIFIPTDLKAHAYTASGYICLVLVHNAKSESLLFP